MKMKLELVPVPVTDVDRSAAFYERLGFVRDVDVTAAEGVRVLPLPPLPPAVRVCSDGGHG
jgi:hypothetical protein